MFLIMIHYKQPLDIIDQYLAEHRAYLELGYQKDYFIVSGPKFPRTGGVILSQIQDRKKLEEVLMQDPFNIHGVADFEIIEFSPVKYHPRFSTFIDT